MQKVGHGKPPQLAWWLGKKFKCRMCGAILRMDNGDDVKPEHRPKNETVYSFACPDCHHVTFIEPKDILDRHAEPPKGGSGGKKADQ